MKNNANFISGQKVMVKTYAEINRKLASGLKLNIIYTIKEVVACPNCSSTMLVLDGTFDLTVTERTCLCGKGNFHPNAFVYTRFDVVNLRIKYKNPVLV